MYFIEKIRSLSGFSATSTVTRFRATSTATRFSATSIATRFSAWIKIRLSKLGFSPNLIFGLKPKIGNPLLLHALKRVAIDVWLKPIQVCNKVLVFLISTFTIFISCNNINTPDVSGIKVNLSTERFEKDFFSIDTLDIAEGMLALQKKYPDFLKEYTLNVLGIHADTIGFKDTAYARALRTFIRDYRAVKDSTLKLYDNFEAETGQIKKALQFVKYYFPEYPIPDKVITFIGPIDAYFQTSFGTQGDIKSNNILGIALQLHLGGNSSYYQNELGLQLYPEFISENFDRDHIPVNCMKLIIDELYPESATSRPLLELMVEKGKRLFLLDKFLPETDEYLKIGYTRLQMKDCYENEALIWDFFLDNELLNNAEANIVKNYIGESPKTQELTNAPGNIGSFAGWQIVKKYMAKNPKTKLDELMKMDAREIYSASKYKPK